MTPARRSSIRSALSTRAVQNQTGRHDRRFARVATKYDPERPVFSDVFATATPLFTTVAAFYCRGARVSMPP